MIAVCLTIPEGLMTTTISIESICVTRNYDLEHRSNTEPCSDRHGTSTRRKLSKINILYTAGYLVQAELYMCSARQNQLAP